VVFVIFYWICWERGERWIYQIWIFQNVWEWLANDARVFSSTLTYKWAKLLYSAQLVLFYVRSLGSFISCCVNWLHGLTFVCQLSSMSLLLFQIIYVVIRLGPLGLSTAAMYACMFQLVAYACVHLCIFITMSFILMLLVWFFQLGPMGPCTAVACACVPLHTCPLIVCCIVASSMWDS
jgi:hypothetical protein